MNNLRILMTTGLLVSAILAGCDGKMGFGDRSRNTQPQRNMVLMTDPNPPIADIPIPINFRLDESKSRHYAAGNARYVDHVYRGSANKNEVADFYRLEMSQNRWELTSDLGSAGVLTLDFDKGSERCVIVISDKFDLFRPTQIHVQMWTTGRLPTPPGGAP